MKESWADSIEYWGELLSIDEPYVNKDIIMCVGFSYSYMVCWNYDELSLYDVMHYGGVCGLNRTIGDDFYITLLWHFHASCVSEIGIGDDTKSVI